MELTASLEDYLEAIWLIGQRDRVVRVRDVAKFLGVRMASVIGALKGLVEKNLVVHERYGYIELTPQGTLMAQEIYEKHRTLFQFFHQMLGVNPEIAEQDACRLEHHISRETLERFLKFIQFVEDCPEGEPLWLTSFHYFARTGKRPEHCLKGGKEMEEMPTLKELKPGEKGKVLRLKGKGEVKRRLLDMGIVPGTEIQVEKVSPLGDPVDVLVKGYHLSLRKEEAELVLIERQ